VRKSVQSYSLECNSWTAFLTQICVQHVKVGVPTPVIMRLYGAME